MKKLYLCLLVFFVFTACKKDRDCVCEIRHTGINTTITKATLSLPGGIPAEIQSSEPYDYETTSIESFEKVSVAGMRAACPTEAEEDVNEVNKSSFPGTFTITVTRIGKREKTCVVE